MSSREITLKFINHEEGRHELLEKAFNAAKAKEITVKYAKEDEIMNSDLSDDKSLFVTDIFEGSCFDYLVSQKKRIYGPVCILQCLERTIPLPNVRQPVFSLAMYKTIVSCTSVSRVDRDNLYNLVERMGATAAKDFRSTVTHLVAGEVGSKKYAIACNLNKMIVLPSWVQKAWDKTQEDEDFDATDPEFTSQHKCPIFKGCAICVTGLDARKRKDIQNIVTEHGGVYMAELKLKVTTHLLVEKPTGDKYEFAVRWNVHCVRPDWLNDCVENGHWVEEANYKVERNLDHTQNTGTTQLSVTTIDATLNNTIVASKKAAEAAQRSAETHGHKDIFRETRLPSEITKTTQNIDFDIEIPHGKMFLDGCKIYLTGFTGERLEKLQRIINCGGATRFNQINASVTHVVMGDKVKKDVDILTTMEFSPYVVTAQWLLDSCRQEHCISEAEYCCMDIPGNLDELPNKVTKEAEKKIQPIKEQINDDKDDDVINQYLKLMNNDQVLSRKPSTESELKNKAANKINDDKRDDSSLHNETTSGLLHKITMRIKGFNQGQQDDLKEVIQSHGGVVLNETSPTLANYAILPMNYECGQCNAENVVTFCWLEQSFENERLLDTKSSFLFTPFCLPKNTLPLKQCVISISQYTGIERDHLTQLAEILGAQYQEYFSRKSKDNFQINTHLLLQEPTGSKYEAAERWEVPALKAEWLFECARQGTKVSEIPYLVNNQQYLKNNNDLEEQGTTKKNGTSNDNGDGKNMMQPPTSNVPKRPHIDISRSDIITKQAPSCFGRPKRPSFDLTDAMEALQSPCCSSSSGTSSNHSRLSRGSGSRSSLLLDDYLQEHIQAALKNTANLAKTKDSTTDDDDRDMGTDHISKEDVENHKILQGIILHVSKKLTKQQNELYKMALEIGASCKRTFDQTCTHVIHEGRLSKEFAQTKRKGVCFVSPHWLYNCIEEQCCVDETRFPTTYNPKLALSVAVKTRRSVSDEKCEIKREDTTELGRQLDNSKQETDVKITKPAIEEVVFENDHNELSKAPEVFDSQQSDSLQTKEEIKQIKGLMEAMKTTRRRSRRVTSSNSSGCRLSGETITTTATTTTSSTATNASVADSNTKPPRRQSSRLRTLRSEECKRDEDELEEPVQTITYDDPKSRIERERIIAQLTDCSPGGNNDQDTTVPRENQETMQNNHDDNKTFDERQVCQVASAYDKKASQPTCVMVKTEQISPIKTQTPKAPPIALQLTLTSNKPAPVSLLEDNIKAEDRKEAKSYKFLLSAMSQQEKIDYGALIEQLGGVVYDTQYFNPVCCHTIVGQLNRNEKCFASIAAGNWVLHKSFLEASRLAGYFVDEEKHEWGVDIPGEQPTALASSAKRWRLKLKKESERCGKKYGAFQKWRVLLCVEVTKVASFTRLLEAGGAKVLETNPPFKNIDNVTHAFINHVQTSLVESVDIEALQKAGILVLRTDYIANYLLENPEPRPEKYIFRKEKETAMGQAKKRKANNDGGESLEKRQKR